MEREEWYDNIEYVDYQEQQLREFEKKKGLIRIEDNIEYLTELQKSEQDFLEYRYAYTYLQPVPIVHTTGKTTYTTFMYIPVTHYSWTTDENHSRLTGETRVCHHVYQAYKVVEENGKLKVVDSPQLEDILETKGEYPYFKEKVSYIVNKKDNQEVDYEDGPEEEVVEQEENYQKTK